MPAPSIKPPPQVGGGIRTRFVLTPGFTESPEAPKGYKVSELKVCVDSSGDTRRAFKFVARQSVVLARRKKAADLMKQIRQERLDAEMRRLRQVFQRRKKA
jgi:hypothetical protein